MRRPNFKKYMDKKNRMRFKYAKYYKTMPVDQNVILFESFHGKEISDTTLAMARALLEMRTASSDAAHAHSAAAACNSPNSGTPANAAAASHLYFSTNDIARDEEVLRKLGLDRDISLVHIHSDEYAKLLATAGLMINNSSFPSYIVRRDGQKYLQTWHGTPWKTLGRSMKGELATMHNAQHNFIQASHLLFPNEFTRDAIMHDYVLDDIFTGKVIINGYPRCAVFSDPAKAAEVKKICGDDGISTLCYMPTWRGQDNRNIETDAYVKETVAMLRTMEEALSDDQKLYVNLHPIIQSNLKLDGFRHIHTFPKDIEKYEFINSMDALITDYSSVFFDYSITGKPIILFTYDYDNYASERGMYFGIEELPFARIDTIDELAGMLRSRSYEKLNYADDKAYFDKFIRYDNANTARDLMQYMLEEPISRASGSAANAAADEPLAAGSAANAAALAAANHDDNTPDGSSGGERGRKAAPELVPAGSGRRLIVEDHSSSAKTPRRIVNCPGIQGRPDLDAVVREIRSGDIAVFHQSSFDAKAGVRFKEAYDGKFPYVFTTEAVPQTMAESLSRSKSVRAEVKQRNLRRQVGRLNMAKSVTIRPPRVELLQIRTNGSMLSLRMKASAKIGKVQKVCLEYRSDIEEIVHEMDFAISGHNNSHPGADHCGNGGSGSGKPGADDRGSAVYGSGKRATAGSSSVSGNINGSDSFIIDASMDMSVLKHGCIYWDIYVLTEQADGSPKTDIDPAAVDGHADSRPDTGVGETVHIAEKTADSPDTDAGRPAASAISAGLRWPVSLDRPMRKKLRRYFYQCELGDYIAFPHISLTHTLAFTHRERTPSDTRANKIKEAVVPVYSIIWSRLNKKRRIWLVFEKFCSAAQDNGYYFFKYCMDNLPADKKKDIYFVIDKKAKDYEKLRPYDSNVLQFMSFRHMLYAINAKVYVGSDSKKHLYTWRPKPNLISIRMGSRPIHFLQHGVTALKKSGVLFGANGSSPMTHVSTTSEFEQHIMDEFWGYSPANAPVLGFTRWDVLEDKSTADEKLILVMPTWRAWLEEKPDEDFLASDYFTNYMELLRDESLLSCLEENDVKLVFFIHPKFKDYLDKFSASSDHIELVQFGSRPLNEIMMKCHMLITDYSSVCWDVYYMGKPVIFWQFDYDMYMESHGSYLDMEHDLFGDRYTELSDVVRGIREAVENGFRESSRAKEMRSHYFKYIDNDNSKRTYEYLKKQGY